MFERFTQEARAVLVAAQDLAVELGSESLGTGHLLYGCAATRESTAGEPLHESGVTEALVRGRLPRTAREVGPGGIDVDALRAIGVDYDGVRASVDHSFGEGALESAPDRRGAAAKVRRPRFTPDAKQTLEQALRVAVELGDRRIRPGHLLLGLLRLDDEIVRAALTEAGVSVAGLSARVLERVEAA